MMKSSFAGIQCGGMIIDVLVDCYLSNYQMIGMCVDMFDIAVGSYVHTYNKNLFFLFYFIFYVGIIL